MNGSTAGHRNGHRNGQSNGRTHGNTPTDRICIIGAGPSGMSAIYQHSLLDRRDKPEVVCYEKQSTWGGLWNFTWMTGTDEFGEPCHGSMYKNLWSNGPKEVLEYDDYSWQEHFDGQPQPSYMPRAHIKKYIEDRILKKAADDVKELIKFNHAVRMVSYNTDTDTFNVTAANLTDQSVLVETFSHVIVAVGIFSAPHKPAIPGIENFQGRVLHAHDLRACHEFKGQRVLIVGGSLSAEDISIMLIKYGAVDVVCSWHTSPMNVNWIDGMEERPPVKNVSKTTVTFNDGTSKEFDAIILCTGYLYKFPFLEDSLQLTNKTSFYPRDLYKGVVWMNGGNKKMFYLGVQNQLFTLPMFDVQATWIWRYILHELLNVADTEKAMRADINKWTAKNDTAKDRIAKVDFQAEYLADLVELTGRDGRVVNCRTILHCWVRDRKDLATFRDKCFASVHTGQMAAEQKPWMENFDIHM